MKPQLIGRKTPPPGLASKPVNDACWAFVEAMPHRLPAPIWNDLKPAVHAAILRFLEETEKTRSTDERKADQSSVTPITPEMLCREILDPERLGHAVSPEVRHLARVALGLPPVTRLKHSHTEPAAS